MTHVSFQGERGAYSEAAARSFFNEQIETTPQATFAEVLENTSNDKTQFSILFFNLLLTLRNYIVI